MDASVDPVIALLTGGWRGVLVIAAAVLAGAWLQTAIGQHKRRRRWPVGRSDFQRLIARGKPRTNAGARPFDAAEQLRTVERATFRRQNLLNRGEARLLKVLDEACAEVAPDWRVMAQVSLGEVLSSPDEEAFRAINSKRVDFLIVDASGQALHAVELQGSGHHLGPAATRDAIKREALRRAGIGYSEVLPGDTPAEIRATVAKLAGRGQRAA